MAIFFGIYSARAISGNCLVDRKVEKGKLQVGYLLQ